MLIPFPNPPALRKIPDDTFAHIAVAAEAMVRAEDAKTRQQAATWLATMKAQTEKGVNKAVIASLTFDRNAEAPPWGNGALYVPRVSWSKSEAIALVNELTAWFIWCEANEQRDQISKITTNLNSRQLMNAAGFRGVPQNGQAWIKVWEQAIGANAMQQLKQRAGFRYSAAVLQKIEQ